MTILLADPYSHDRSLRASQLRHLGYEVIEASDSEEALERISSAKKPVSMFIAGNNTKTSEGVALARQVKALTEDRHEVYTIVTVDAARLSIVAEELMQESIDDYLVYPFEEQEFCMRVQNGWKRLKGIEVTDGKFNTLKMLVKNQTKAIRKQTSTIRLTQDEIFCRLFNALEARDQETANHVHRIGVASAFMGNLLGWSNTRVETIRSAAPLHDIGKIGISDAILLKPGPLGKKEYEIIKQHTVKGARILSGSKNKIIKMGELIALSHHENWDGSGYPNGLQGKEIPLEARVVSVVDVYDALLSDRVYRAGFTEQEALEEIQKNAGRKFDPELVELFVKNIRTVRLHLNQPEQADYLV